MPASLLLGPMLRFVGEREAVFWVETDARCEVEVLGARERTFCVEGHHYALVHADGLEPGTRYGYEVLLDGERAWPLADSELPPSSFRTYPKKKPLEIVFGSCRVHAPHHPPYSLPKDEDEAGREIDSLRALAERMVEHEPGRRVLDYEEYTRLYQESWSEPMIRWLLSVVSSAMIFDDHDVHDDWNTSEAWVEEARSK